MPTFVDLQTAIRGRDAAKVRDILAAAPELAATRPAEGPSAVLLACYVGSEEIAQALLRHVAPDACEAAALGDVGALRRLLDEAPGRSAARSGDGWTPLHLAGFFGRRAAVELLLARKASLTAVSGGAEKNTPLHAALAGAGDAEIVRAMIAHGADVTAVGANRYTPLHVAASRGDEGLIRLLVEAGARVSAEMDGGQTPVEVALSRGHTAAAKLLGDLARLA